MSPYVPPSRWYLRLPRWSVCVLSVVVIDGLWVWFLMKCFLPSASGTLETLVAALAAVSTAALFPLQASTYGYWAHATTAQIDERQAAQRQTAFYWTLLYVLTGILLAYISVDAERLQTLLTMSVIRNYLFVLFLTALAMPTALLAWFDSGAHDDAG